MCMLCVNTLSKVVSHYYLSVLSMSVMGFQKKFRQVGELYPFFCCNFFNFAKPLICPSKTD